MKTCLDCDKPVSARAKRCRTHANLARNSDPDFIAKRSASMKKRLEDPAIRHEQVTRLRDALRHKLATDPDFVEQRREWGRQVGGWNRGRREPPELVRRRAESLSNNWLRHIPVEHRASYKRFIRRGYGVVESTRLIQEIVDAEKRQVHRRFEAAGFNVKALKESQ